MNLPFAPGPTSTYAPTRLTDGIVAAGYKTEDVQVVVPSGSGWLVFFQDPLVKLLVR